MGVYAKRGAVQLVLFEMKSVFMPHPLKQTAVLQAAPGMPSTSSGCSAVSGSKGFSLHSTSVSSFS